MIDVRLVDETGTPMTTPTSSEAGSDSEQEESDGGMTEIRFVPDDKAALDAMFASMSECQVSVKLNRRFGQFGDTKRVSAKLVFTHN